LQHTCRTEYQPAPSSSTEGHDPPKKRNQSAAENLVGTIEFRSRTCGTTEEHSRKLLKKAVSKAAGELKPEAYPRRVR
jgi:hypothetical protein